MANSDDEINNQPPEKYRVDVVIIEDTTSAVEALAGVVDDSATIDSGLTYKDAREVFDAALEDYKG